MLAFEITINNDKKILAGSDDIDTLSAHITALGNLSDGVTNSSDPETYREISLNVSGLDASYGDDRQYNLDWIKQIKLKEGDELIIRIVETDNADEAINIIPANRSIPEEFERVKEMRKALKANYDMIEEVYGLWKERMDKRK